MMMITMMLKERRADTSLPLFGSPSMDTVSPQKKCRKSQHSHLTLGRRDSFGPLAFGNTSLRPIERANLVLYLYHVIVYVERLNMENHWLEKMQ